MHADEIGLDSVKGKILAVDSFNMLYMFLEDGLRCIGAPVRDYTRKVVGAISVSGPAHRLSVEKIAQQFGPEVARAARALSARLGFRE